MAEVLVVEAEDLTRRLLQARLQDAGHLVRAAASVAGAHDLVARFGFPDVVVSDLFLPAGSGLHLVTHLRTDLGSAAVPVIFLSGRALPADIEAARAVGASYLPKPVSLEALTGAIMAALRPVDATVEQTVRGRLAAFGNLDEFEQDLIAELLSVFVQRAPAAQHAAELAMATNDAEALQSAVRRLMAAARNLGADALVEVCVDLDVRAGLGEFPIPIPLAARFRRVLGASCRVFAELAAEFRNEPVDDGLVGAAHA